jgi:hypothetical protein
MTSEPAGFAIRRIIVALESACENIAALERAARLAQLAKAELHAMFIEDARLLEAAALPFTRQVNLASGALAPLDPGHVEEEFRALAARARRCLQDLAGRMDVAWSFEIVRGDRASALSVAAAGDLLVVESTTRAVGRNLRISTDWFGTLAGCGRACLLLGPARDARRNVLVIHDGSAAGERAVAAALALGGIDHARLTLARTAGAPDAEELHRRFATAPRPLMVRDMPALDTAGLRRAIAAAECGLVVAPAPLVAAHQAELQGFLASPSSSLLMVT